MTDEPKTGTEVLAGAADEARELSEDALTRLGELARRQIELEDEIEALETELKAKKAACREVSEDSIPSLLDDTGLSEVRLSDGTRVEVRENLRVSTTGKYREPIHAWLAENGHDDIIKDEVVARFARGEGEAAERLIAAAGELTDAVDRKRSVAPQTFAALLRELLEDGITVPLEELGVYVQRRTKLERQK